MDKPKRIWPSAQHWGHLLNEAPLPLLVGLTDRDTYNEALTDFAQYLVGTQPQVTYRVAPPVRPSVDRPVARRTNSTGHRESQTTESWYSGVERVIHDPSDWERREHGAEKIVRTQGAGMQSRTDERFVVDAPGAPIHSSAAEERAYRSWTNYDRANSNWKREQSSQSPRAAARSTASDRHWSQLATALAPVVFKLQIESMGAQALIYEVDQHILDGGLNLVSWSGFLDFDAATQRMEEFALRYQSKGDPLPSWLPPMEVIAGMRETSFCAWLPGNRSAWDRIGLAITEHLGGGISDIEPKPVRADHLETVLSDMDQGAVYTWDETKPLRDASLSSLPEQQEDTAVTISYESARLSHEIEFAPQGISDPGLDGRR